MSGKTGFPQTFGTRRSTTEGSSTERQVGTLETGLDSHLLGASREVLVGLSRR